MKELMKKAITIINTSRISISVPYKRQRQSAEPDSKGDPAS
jgi:hypothetical protein